MSRSQREYIDSIIAKIDPLARQNLVDTADIYWLAQELRSATNTLERICTRADHPASVTAEHACVDCQRARAIRAETELEALRVRGGR